MRQVISPPSRIEGTVVPPGDKSVSQRAVLLNSVASGKATISNYSPGGDAASMLRCLRGLGVKIERVKHGPGRRAYSLVVHGKGPHGLCEPAGVLNAGNSGTTMRLVSGLVAAQPFFTVISGDRSLRSRPMTRIVQPLTRMGAQILGRGEDQLAPLAIRGGDLKGIDHAMPVASAQVKSCLLIAGLYAEGQTTVLQPAASRDHTERMLRAMGADVDVQGLRVVVRPSELSPVDVEVPGDISAAAFWLIAACCHPNARVRVQGVGINPTRAGVLDILRSMGARVRVENVSERGGEPVADLVAESSHLQSTMIRGDIVPRVIDELPVLALAACFASGTTEIRDAAELRVKESDRIRATAESLSDFGANVQELPDGLVIHGVDHLTGGDGRSYGDHRIAMLLAVAGLLARGETTIDGAEAASVTYPSFWDDLRALAHSQ